MGAAFVLAARCREAICSRRVTGSPNRNRRMGGRYPARLHLAPVIPTRAGSRLMGRSRHSKDIQQKIESDPKPNSCVGRSPVAKLHGTFFYEHAARVRGILGQPRETRIYAFELMPRVRTDHHLNNVRPGAGTRGRRFPLPPKL
jgi:hypothetical protein